MPGPRKSTTVPGGVAAKNIGSRQSSFLFKADQTVSATDTKTPQRKKTGRKSSTKVLSEQHTKKDPTTQKKEKPVYDVEATKKFDNMLRGGLTDLPPLRKTMVKIFLSSTFSDMREERNTLAREVYPRLQTFCASRGLDFQAVDMRWGVTEDSINDHSVENLCLLEIENCQKTSIGPNFVVEGRGHYALKCENRFRTITAGPIRPTVINFKGSVISVLSGDRYGFRPVPVNLDVKTFEIIQHEANTLNLKDKDLLEEWYKLDENSVPATYILQPIRSKFTFYGDLSPGCDELRERDTTEWWKTFEKLQILLKKSADEAFTEKKLTAEEKHKFFQSVTESEIQDGILNAADVNLHCLVYKRRLRHLYGVGLNDRDTPRYIDVIKCEKGNMLDEEVEMLKTSLDEKLRKKLDPANIKEYSIHWMPGGVNPDRTDEHREYLASFCKDFIADCKSLIQKAEVEKKKRSIRLSKYYTDYDSTIHHLRFCVSKCELFCGQEQVLEAAKSYILDRSRRKPLVLYAPSGVGKTSIMSMIMTSIPQWLNNASHLKMIRFLGTLPQSSNVYDVLVDVLGHLSDVYDMIMSPPSYKTMKKVVQFAPRYIRQVANYAKEPIIILLDSLDQLYSWNNAYSMDWLPIFLPQNVKIIVSTLPKENGILANLKKRLPDRECYIEVPTLTEHTARQIIETSLKNNNRSLTATQMSLFWSVFKQAQSPLYLKLLLDEARKWKSYTPGFELELASTAREAINKLFQNLEKKFGTRLVSHALGFVTVGLAGLAEIEIEDALSCDDDVLNEVYRFHDPPVEGIVQIPPLLWARIWYDIRDYLVERMSYGKTTLNWYHREFAIAATEIYTKGDKEELLNKILFEIYRQENGVKRTIILQNRNQLEITDADRQVTPQPYKADNKRKLACLSYHTLRAYQTIGIDQAKADVYCNFKYLFAKVTAFSVSAVINDLSDFVGKSKDEEVRLLLNFIVNCKQDLTNQIRFAFCLLAYVNPEQNHNQLKELLNAASEFLESTKKPVLIPEFPCLAQRRDASNAFQKSIQGISDVFAVSNNNVLLQRPVEIDKISDDDDECQTQSDIAVWSAETQELTNVAIKEDVNPADSYILSDEYLYYITKTAVVQYRLNDSNTEEVLFEHIITEWNISKSVPRIFANSEATVGVLTQDCSITLISLERLANVHEFKVPDKNMKILKVFVLSNGQKLIAVGKIQAAPAKNEGQNMESQSFIMVFEHGKSLPVQFLELNKQLDYKNAVLSCRDQWFLIPANEALVATEFGKQTEVEQSESRDHILAFDIGESYFAQKEIQISSNVSEISVHPEKRTFIFLTSNGKVFSVLANEFSAKAIDLEIRLNFTVHNFTVSWEDEISFFCSSGGKLAMYDLNSDKILLVFVAHSEKIKSICLLDQQFITLAEDQEMRSWTVKTLLQDSRSDEYGIDSNAIEEKLLEQSNLVAISSSCDGSELMTSHDDGIVKVWSVESQSYIRQYNIGIAADIVHTFSNGSVVFHDTKAGKIRILDIITGRVTFQLPNTIDTILHSTTDKKDNLYILSSHRKGKEQIDIVSISREMVMKTIHLQSGLLYQSVDTVLSTNERYLVLRLLMSEQDFDHVRELYHQNFPWKKGGFSEQQHRYRFTAVALSEGSGALIPCNRIAYKVPTIGIYIQPYRGNIMLISTRRWIVFWDIPTGSCDRKPSKLQKVPMFFRPAWIGRECMGATRIFVQSSDKKYVACGSDDGYVFVYDSDSGLPVCNRKPVSKHNTKVYGLVVSPDSKWVASSCRNCVLKLWESSTGLEQFLVRLDAEVKGMCFTPDSRRLVLFTGTYTTRVLLFSVSGDKKKL